MTNLSLDFSLTRFSDIMHSFVFSFFILTAKYSNVDAIIVLGYISRFHYIWRTCSPACTTLVPSLSPLHHVKAPRKTSRSHESPSSFVFILFHFRKRKNTISGSTHHRSTAECTRARTSVAKEMLTSSRHDRSLGVVSTRGAFCRGGAFVRVRWRKTPQHFHTHGRLCPD